MTTTRPITDPLAPAPLGPAPAEPRRRRDKTGGWNDNAEST